ncbi:hypothetical protein PC116_g9009 [Phytophthora cactorum]|nr:hypothetical protein PC116_g9009 [Phytophthora cactorum]
MMRAKKENERHERGDHNDCNASSRDRLQLVQKCSLAHDLFHCEQRRRRLLHSEAGVTSSTNGLHPCQDATRVFLLLHGKPSKRCSGAACRSQTTLLWPGG